MKTKKRNLKEWKSERIEINNHPCVKNAEKHGRAEDIASRVHIDPSYKDLLNHRINYFDRQNECEEPED
jgi:hypothetical protein